MTRTYQTRRHDVARWVACLAVHYDNATPVKMRKRLERDQAQARGQLALRGLDAKGRPLDAASSVR